MSVIRLGAVGYLNARPLVFGLEQSSRFGLRFDVPSRCAELLHAQQIDVGLIPTIEYLRGSTRYAIVPGPAVTSRGPVASVALYTRKDPADVRTIAMDSSSRTSIALTEVLVRRVFGIAPEAVPMSPALGDMLDAADAALVIGDNALFLDHETAGPVTPVKPVKIVKIDLGALWTRTTGLPFVYAFWAGRPGALAPGDVTVLQHARDEGASRVEEVATAYFPDDRARQAVAARYLRDNIQYSLGEAELEGLRTFYAYAAEAGLVSFDGSLTFYDADRPGPR